LPVPEQSFVPRTGLGCRFTVFRFHGFPVSRFSGFTVSRFHVFLADLLGRAAERLLSLTPICCLESRPNVQPESREKAVSFGWTRGRCYDCKNVFAKIGIFDSIMQNFDHNIGF
jgi:hypothetical protein